MTSGPDSAPPDPRPRLERRIARALGDDQPGRFGSGWWSGVLSVFLGVCACLGVLAFWFPWTLSAPDVRARMDGLVARLGCASADEARNHIRTLMQSIGLQTRLGELGIEGDDDRARIAAGVNAQRLSNNPRSMSPDGLRSIVDAVA